MKRIVQYVALAGLLTAFTEAFAQGRVQVYSRDEKKPLPNAPLTYTDLSGKKSHSLLTNSEGEAFIPAAFTATHAAYLLRIHYLGFETLTDTLRGQTEKRYYLAPKNMDLQEVVVTAQYAPGNIENSVHKIRVIGQEKITSMAAVNLKDVLTNELNIRLEQDNILGSSMSMQGISGENVKIMLDGVPMIGRQNGNLDLSQINLNDVERIEIVEGPLSVNYGTNALAGTINIITKKNSTAKTSVNLSSYNENIGTFNLNAAAAVRLKAHRVSLSGLRNYFDGWNSTDAFLPDFSRPIANDSRFKQWKPREQYSSRLQYNYQFKNLLFGYKAEYFKEKITNRGMPDAAYKETGFDDYYYTARLDNAVYLSGALSENKNINFVAAYNHYNRIKNTYIKHLPTLKQKLSVEKGAQDTSDFEQVMSRGSFATSNETSWINYELGYDVNYETATGARIENNWKDQGDFAGFATAELKPWSKLTVRPGLRYSYNTAYGAPLVPSLNLKADLQKITLRASYARGFRAPSLKEIYFEFVDTNHKIFGNPDLQAEYSNNFTMGLTHKQTLWDQFSLQTEAGVFFNDINNLITLAQVDSVNWSYVNIGKNKTTGANLNLSLRRQQLSINLGGTYTGRYNDLAADDASVNNYNFSPEMRANLQYLWPRANVQFAAFYKYQGRLTGYRLSSDNKIMEMMMDAYHTTDLTLTRFFRSEMFAVALGCKNLFDVESVRSTASSGAHSTSSGSVSVSTGRLFFVKLDFKLEK